MLPNGYKEFIQEKINEFYIENRRLPHKNDLKDYSVEPLIFEYGNWKHALSALGFLSKENINEEFKDLLQLQDELQGPPSLEEAKEAGINTKLLIDTYDGWRNVKKELKNKTTKTYKIKKTKIDQFNKKVQKDEILLIEITKHYTIVPTVQIEIDNQVEINRILKKYDTWSNAKKELKLYEIYENEIIKKIKKIGGIDKEKIEKELKKTNEKYKPELKSLILKYKTWKNVCKIFNLKSTVEFTNDEEKIIEKSLQNIELIEKIIGQFPSISDAKDYDINVDLLLKKYGSWEILRKWIENNK